MDNTTYESSQANILARAIDSQQDGLTLEVAEFVSALKLAAADEARLTQLAAKALSGHLAETEEAELEEFRRCGRLIEMLKLKALKVLQAK
ncbi:MAG: hypothetical protein AAF497_14085 [Planctomycetota bacterium]